MAANFFDMLGRRPALGRVFTAAEFENQERVAIVGHRLWSRRFGGSPGALGKVLHFSGLNFTVIGVMADDFRLPGRSTQLWIPASTYPQWQTRRATRSGRFGVVLARLAPTATLERARTEMTAIARNLEQAYPEANTKAGINLVPLQVQVNGTRVPFMLLVLFGAVMLVLLIACTNVANLLLARGAAREREIALRTALGAGRSRIVRQLLTESVVLSFLAGCLALPLAVWSVRALVALAPQDIARLDEVRVDATVLLFSLAVSLLSGIIFGLTPAMKISRSAVVGRFSANRRLQPALIAGEVALSVVLLTGAGLLIRSLQAVLAVDPGFKTYNVLTATLRFHTALPRAERANRYREAIDRIGRLPGVEAVGATGEMLRRGDSGAFGLRAVEGRAPENQDQWTPLSWETISGRYFQVAGVPLLRGRLFSHQDRPDAAPVAIVNETMARRFWPGQDPTGRRFKGFDARGRNDDWVTVVGLVKDVHTRGRDQRPEAQIFMPQQQSLDETEDLVVSATAGPAQLAPEIRRTIASVDPTAVLMSLSTLERRIEQQTTERRFQTYLLGLFALIALALASIGIFGAMHYSVVQRTREIGVRMALGARASNVAAMVMSEGVALAAIGITLGLAVSFALMRTLTSLLFGVTPTDPATFAAVALLLAAFAAVACYLPARRATQVDPMRALRCE